MKGRKAKLRVGQDETEWCDLAAGLGQGSAMSPILFDIYVSDLEQALRKVIDTLHDCEVTFDGYADDKTVCIATRRWKRLEEAVNLIYNAIYQWSVRTANILNPTKTDIMAFVLESDVVKKTWKKKEIQVRQDLRNDKIEITLRHPTMPKPLPWKPNSSVRALGYHVGTRLDWHEHTTKKLTSFRFRVNQICTLNRPGCRISDASRLDLLRSWAMPLLTSGVCVWSDIGQAELQRIIEAVRKAIRDVTRTVFNPSEQKLYQSVSMDQFELMRQKAILNGALRMMSEPTQRNASQQIRATVLAYWDDLSLVEGHVQLKAYGNVIRKSHYDYDVGELGPVREIVRLFKHYGAKKWMIERLVTQGLQHFVLPMQKYQKETTIRGAIEISNPSEPVLFFKEV